MCFVQNNLAYFPFMHCLLVANRKVHSKNTPSYKIFKAKLVQQYFIFEPSFCLENVLR